MNGEQDKVKKIFMGYHPRTHDGSSPQSRSHSDAVAIMEAFNEQQTDGKFHAELMEIAYSDLCAVAVMETTLDKVWQYL